MQTLTIDTPEGACDIYAARSRYPNGTLAVVLAHASGGRLLGPLTVNLQPYGARGQSARRAYVRSRQAESPLVKGALEALGARDTGRTAFAGFELCRLYEFPN